MAYLHLLLITMHEIDTVGEVYLERLSFFAKIVNGLRKKGSILTGMVPGAEPEIFQCRGGFVKLRHFDKHLT